MTAGGRGGPRHGADGAGDRQPDQDRPSGDKPLELEADQQNIDGLVCLLTSALSSIFYEMQPVSTIAINVDG